MGPVPTLDNNWPQAVEPHLIVTNKGPGEKQFRALQITRMLGNFEGQTVLDVGCGEGYISREIANQATKVVGYDIKKQPTWTKLSVQNTTFTIARGEVEANRYDTIVLYDVIDHLEGVNQIEMMTWLNSLLNQDGKILVRTHPWTAKHGGHLYEVGHNFAYLHLAMTVDELVQIGIDVPPVLRLNRPMAAYEFIFKQAGLKVVDRKGNNDPVDQFFEGVLLDRIIKVTWQGKIASADALKIMSNSFIDYTLVAQ